MYDKEKILYFSLMVSIILPKNQEISVQEERRRNILLAFSLIDYQERHSSHAKRNFILMGTTTYASCMHVN